MSNPETLTGNIERITFYNENTGWCVLRVSPDSKVPEAALMDGTVTVIGVMPQLVEGETAQFTGTWVKNPQYGLQMRATQVIALPPKRKEGILRYLSDQIHGVGSRTAERIYDTFGSDTLRVLDETPERVREVPGLKPSLADSIIEQWSQNRVQRQIMIHLQSYGMTSSLAQKVYKTYGSDTLHIVRTNPYQLAEEVYGVGFKRADAIARGVGIAPDSRLRLRAGLVYALAQLASSGHTFVPRPLLLKTAADLLESGDAAALEEELQYQLLSHKIVADKLPTVPQPTDAIYLPAFLAAERGAAHRLRMLAATPSALQRRMTQTEWPTYLHALAQRNNVTLSDQQQSAVQAALCTKISVLTGGPGTGKTTTLQMVINALEQEQVAYVLASPTGRAAKRLSEATERSAQTIHRMLGYSGEEGDFEYNEDNPLSADFVILDETSMLDLLLLHSLLKALRPTTHLMLVGDVDQLPSVGAGNVLNDIIQSGIAHVTRLTQIFRQAANSHIVTNAHRINHGDLPYLENQSEDFFFFNITDPSAAAEMIVDIVVNRLAKKIGEYDRVNDVQVIAPMYRGPIGVDALNLALQAQLNPQDHVTAERQWGGSLFRRGDKVMQTRNNYDKDVFNGDIGRVRSFDFVAETMEVVIDERIVTYTAEEAQELILAYCISTHRSQGSEYPIVVMPVMPQHHIMLQRNLLYTAITRARRLVVLVGDRKAVAIAVHNNRVAERYSGLLPRIRRHPS